MRTIGITGRSGSGKSSVSAVLRAHGYPVADADALAREVVKPGEPCLAALAAHFGKDILLPDGSLDRRLLADRAFASPEGTAFLTNATFAAIIRLVGQERDKAQKKGSSLFFVDGAVLVGTPFEKECEALILVTAPLDVSTARIMKRDGISRESALRRLAAQPGEDTLRKSCRFEVVNDVGLEHVQAQVEAILAELAAECV